MTKTDLQKELLEKVKPGTKPSDIKKERQKEAKKPISPSPIVQDDEGYESEEEIVVPTVPTKKEKELQNQIHSLQRQLQTYKDFKDADLKIKERQKQEIVDYKETINNLQTKIKELNKSIADLQKQVKNTAKNKEPNNLFTCSQCELEWGEEFCKLVDKKGNKTCSECLENMLVKEEKEVKPELIKPCQFCSKPFPSSELKPRHIKNLPNHDSREITFICQTCLTYRAIKDKKIVYCPRLGTGRDTYEGAEYDCYCQSFK